MLIHAKLRLSVVDMLTLEQINLLSKCKNDKEVKSVFKEIASKNPDIYFPTKELKALGYMRKQCTCGKYFWTTNKDREICGDPACSGGYQVVNSKPLKHKLSYIQVWKKIVGILEPRGYVPIKRYPCVARWNPTSEFTIASISAFQPYVVNGEMEPPAKRLLIPQFCLRFNDIENVGVTSAHLCGFVMIGQHVFVSPEEWDQGQLFLDMHDFIHEGVGLAKEEITIHEDSWAGGGSFGCSLEFFSKGVELFNQVYTLFEQTPQGPKELKLKVLDMGLGQERLAWFSQGTPNLYEATFPEVLKKLKKIIQMELDLELYTKFSKYSASLNLDEVDDIKKAWERVAKELNIDVAELREKILPLTALYSIAEHARSLLFAINDGMLPSNVGGGYNLRVIFRRAMNFIDRFNWNIDLADVCEWHAEELKELFPEVSNNLDDIREILNAEKEKYYTTKKNADRILKKIFKKGNITDDILIELYDSKGISPDMVKEMALKLGKRVSIPENFYSLVVERHEQQEKPMEHEKEIDIDLDGIPETKSLYYYDYTQLSNKAKVLKIIDNMVIVDESVAYPTSGGQLHDIGTINGQPFNEVFKKGNHVIHVLTEPPKFKEGDVVEIKVDKNWRTQLTQHHTATHIVNAAAREILGNHVNQAGAKKTEKNSHLDITHYDKISKEQLEKIEKRANEIVEQAIDIQLDFLPRSEAEKKYGMRIYQGGAVPGKYIRIVEIPGIDVEACGGTHLNNTSETGTIKIIKSQKIQDGVVRLTFTAGKATELFEHRRKKIIKELETLLNVEENKLVGRVKELLTKWKELKKNVKKGKIDKKNLKLTSQEIFKGDPLSELSNLLNIKETEIPFKVKKIYDEWNEIKTKVEKIASLFAPRQLNKILSNAVKCDDFRIVINHFKDLDTEDIKNLNKALHKKNDDLITLLVNTTKNGVLLMGMVGKKVAQKSNTNIGEFIKNCAEIHGGKGGGSKIYGQAFIEKVKTPLNDFMEYLKTKLIEDLNKS
ncbi:MAG: alanine--tRNA ligase [Promethearchaeota archaeon]